MNKSKILGVIFITFNIVSSCETINDKKDSQQFKIDYKSKVVLDSLIKVTPHSTDTLFLGFTIGMTKSDYKNNINKLRNEGKNIAYSNSNRISTIAGTFDLGEGFTFSTGISTEYSGKTMIGQGQYFLEPLYNKTGNLMQLNVLPSEKWEGEYVLQNPQWLRSRVQEKSNQLSDESLRQALIDNKITDEYKFIRQKDNLIIYETTYTVNYVDLKTLYLELLMKEKEKEIIEDKNKGLKF